MLNLAMKLVLALGTGAGLIAYAAVRAQIALPDTAITSAARLVGCYVPLGLLLLVALLLSTAAKSWIVADAG